MVLGFACTLYHQYLFLFFCSMVFIRPKAGCTEYLMRKILRFGKDGGESRTQILRHFYNISFIEVWNRPQRFFKEHASFLLNAAWSLLYIEKHHPLLTPFYSWVLTSQNFPSPSKTYSQYMWYKMSVEDERKTLYQNWICSFCLESRWSLWRNQTIDSFFMFMRIGLKVSSIKTPNLYSQF